MMNDHYLCHEIIHKNNKFSIYLFTFSKVLMKFVTMYCVFKMAHFTFQFSHAPLFVEVVGEMQLIVQPVVITL